MIVEKTIKIEKDAVEIAKLLVDLVDCIKNKKDYSLIIADLIPAIDGMNTLVESWEQNRSLVMGSFSFELMRLIDVFDPKKV